MDLLLRILAARKSREKGYGQDVQSYRFWFQILTGLADIVLLFALFVTGPEHVNRKSLPFLYIYFGSSILRLVRIQPVCITIYQIWQAEQLKKRKGLPAHAPLHEQTGAESARVSEVLLHRNDQQWLDRPVNQLQVHERQMLVFTSKMIEPSVTRSLHLQLKLINRVRGAFESSRC